MFQSTSGTLDDFLEGAYQHLKIGYPKFFKMDHLSKLGFLAAEVILQADQDYSGLSLVLSNASSSLDTDIRYQKSTESVASPALFVYTLPNIVAGEICIRHKIKGENAFFVTEKFDPAFIHGYVNQVMDKLPNGKCLAGWVEVLGDHHDVFLYLQDGGSKAGIDHTPGNLNKLYNT